MIKKEFSLETYLRKQYFYYSMITSLSQFCIS